MVFCISWCLMIVLNVERAACARTLFVSAGPIVFVLRRLFFVFIAFSRPGSDLLSRVLRRSTIGAGAFHGRVRNGNGCGRPAITTRSAKGNVPTF